MPLTRAVISCMRCIVSAAFVTLALAPAAAQRLSHPVMASRDDVSPVARRAAAEPETLRVLAALVQFQVDTDTRTTGNGHFDLSTPPDSTIDPPPRNPDYFRGHLGFLETYYRRVSRGRLILHTTLVDSVITLPSTMAAYSPPKSGSNKPVADLVRDTWVAVDGAGIVNDFAQYNAFIIFHAGAGRDIDLVNILGYDPTPLDIPSLYFGHKALKEIYGADYPGIPVENGQFFITNSIVLPETESRELPGVNGTFLLELGTNGLLCASFGNYLGLPDLFDTRTGRSGIGRFGLMDGASIFSFAGCFPPEPSAWERYWLGWLQPISVTAGQTDLRVPAVGLGSSDPLMVDTVYQVPLSPREYYLVENRNRDPLGDGQRITTVFRGVTRQQVFRRDTSGFNAFDISALAGIVTDVQDFDWSLPGGLDDQDRFYDGGMLVWHIDEDVLMHGLPLNEVNADPGRRGICLEEADGSQDIGQQYGDFTAGSGSEQGTALDFWFAQNLSPVYRNEFSVSTFPDTRTNSGANGHVSLSNFSPRGPVMTVRALVGDSLIMPLPGFPRATGEELGARGFGGLTIGDPDGDGVVDLLVATTGDQIERATTEGTIALPRQRSKLYLFHSDTSVHDVWPEGRIAISGSVQSAFAHAPTLWPGATGTQVVFGESTADVPRAGMIRGVRPGDGNGDSLADDLFARPVGYAVDSPPVAAESLAAFAGSSGWVTFLNLAGMPVDSMNASTEGTVYVSRWKDPNAFVLAGEDGGLRITSRKVSGGVSTADRTVNLGLPISSPAVTGRFGRGVSIACIAGGDLYLVDENLAVRDGYPRTGINAIASPALADIDGDGARDIVLFSSRSVWAFHENGSVLDHFPVVLTILPEDSIASSPVVADVDGDGAPDIVGATKQGFVFALDRRGSMRAGFPLQAGTGRQTLGVFMTRTAAPQLEQIVVAVASEQSGSLSAFRTGFAAGPVAAAAWQWPQFQRDAQRSGLALEPLQGQPVSSEFFPESRAYNWPNPAYEGKTYIRFFVREDARVEIRIFDGAGDLVKSIDVGARGGIDTDVEWDLTGVQSGVYFARVRATSGSSEGAATMKIAVVK